jgi:hypothetical protein
MDLLYYFRLPEDKVQATLYPSVKTKIVSVSEEQTTKLTERMSKNGMTINQFFTIGLERQGESDNDWQSSRDMNKAVFQNTHGIMFNKIKAFKATHPNMADWKLITIHCRFYTINSLVPYKTRNRQGQLTGGTSYTHTLILFQDESLTTALAARVRQLEDNGDWAEKVPEQGDNGFGGDIPAPTAEELIAGITK